MYKVRVISQVKGSRHITSNYYNFNSIDIAQFFANSEALNRANIVDLLDNEGNVLIRYSVWAS